MKVNALSALGRMNFATYLGIYPVLGAAYFMMVKPYMAARAEKAKQDEWDALKPAKVVDPDTFSPFTPIPYHNSSEMRYALAHIKLRNFIQEAHLNEQDYVWRNYHNSFDHGNKGTYKWNWANVQ